MDGSSGPRLGGRTGLTLDPAPINLRDHPGRPLDPALRGQLGRRGHGFGLCATSGRARVRAVVGAVAEPREAIRKTIGVRLAGRMRRLRGRSEARSQRAADPWPRSRASLMVENAIRNAIQVVASKTLRSR